MGTYILKMKMCPRMSYCQHDIIKIEERTKFFIDKIQPNEKALPQW